jgi:fermentation-respiration switch protein FrsA (DUF1100 family)
VLLSVALTAIVVYFVLLGLLWARQERIVFQPPLVLRDVGFDLRRGVRQVSYRADDGIELFAYVVGDPVRSRRLLIAFHGNADLASNLIPWAATAAQSASIAVLLPELRGYGGLTGRPTYIGAALDARAAARFAVETLGVPLKRVAYFGHSLGSAIATELASEQRPIALLLQSPFSSARAMARRMALPGLTLFWPLVSRVHYDTAQRVSRLQVPVSVAHGLRDMIVPARMGREIYDAAAVKGELLLVADAGHNDVAERDPEGYWRWFQNAVLA